jgi:hypothetical protein
LNGTYLTHHDGGLGMLMLHTAIKALEIAKGLWEESRAKTFPIAAQAPRQQTPTDPPQAAKHQEASKLPNESN